MCSSSRRIPDSRMGILYSPSSSSITSSTSLSTLDFYTRLTPKSQPTTTLSSIVVSGSDSGIASIGPEHENASFRLKGMMKSPSYVDDEKHSDSDEESHSDTIRGRRSRYTSFPVGRLMSSITRNFSVSSSRTSSPTPSRTRLRPPRIIITPPPSTSTSPRINRPSRSNSYATNSITVMNPILAKLETDSIFCGIQVACSTCGKVGRGYPRCGRCGDMWCSRVCRVGSGGRKHNCRKAI